MIIKRNLKSQMPSPKRRRLGDSVSEDDECAAERKKRRKMNGYCYPLNLLAGVIPASFRGLLGAPEKGCQLAPSPEGYGGGGGGKKNASQPALVRTSRGRVQVLPSRFKDSVIEDWRKDSIVECEFGDEFESVKKSRKGKSNKGRGYSALCEEVLHKNFDSAACKEFGELRSNEGVLKEEEKKDGLYGPEDFYAGDIVWAKARRKEPFWPAIVIDPMCQAPELVLNNCVPDTACVMFLGYSRRQNQRDYAWVKYGMIFSFINHVDRFQGQSELGCYNSSELQMAIEEAFLADQGFTEKLIADINIAAGNTGYSNSILKGFQDLTASNQNAAHQFPNQDLFDRKKDSRPCEVCGLELPFIMSKKTKDLNLGGQFLCKACARLTKAKHCCGICKKIWNHSDSGSWVCCDGCKVWVHAECDKILSNLFKNLGGSDYFCPSCKIKFDFELSDSDKSQPKVKWKKNGGQLVLPNKVTVLCNGVEGIYFPSLHLCIKH